MLVLKNGQQICIFVFHILIHSFYIIINSGMIFEKVLIEFTYFIVYFEPIFPYQLTVPCFGDVIVRFN